MTEQLVLEVVDGPMDGLSCLLDKQGVVGRSVGTVLSLALDQEISGRHAELFIEGPSWCLKDLNSTNGTWFNGKKITPGKVYPLTKEDIFLIGSSIIQLFEGSILDVLGSVSSNDFNDPRQHYTLSPELQNVWDSLYSAVPAEGTFCDSSKLLLALHSHIHGTTPFDCISSLQGQARYGTLTPWLKNVTLVPSLQTMPATLIIAPRVWRILDLAAKKAQESIQAVHLIKAYLEEGRSLAAKYIISDRNFLSTFGIFVGGGTATQPAQPDTGNVAKEQPDTAAQAHVTPATTDENISQLIDHSAQSATVHHIALDFAQKIDRIVRGFLEDAADPVSGAQKLHINGFDDHPLSDLLSSPTGPGSDEKLAEHLDTLVHALVLILAAQREGYMIFANKLCTRLDRLLTKNEDKGSNLLSLAKKSDTSPDVTAILRATLSKVESEGLSEQVVRQKIRKKIRLFNEKS